jgi:hypothetical protein
LAAPFGFLNSYLRNQALIRACAFLVTAQAVHHLLKTAAGLSTVEYVLMFFNLSLWLGSGLISITVSHTIVTSRIRGEFKVVHWL